MVSIARWRWIPKPIQAQSVMLSQDALKVKSVDALPSIVLETKYPKNRALGTASGGYATGAISKDTFGEKTKRDQLFEQKMEQGTDQMNKDQKNKRDPIANLKNKEVDPKYPKNKMYMDQVRNWKAIRHEQEKVHKRQLAKLEWVNHQPKIMTEPVVKVKAPVSAVVETTQIMNQDELSAFLIRYTGPEAKQQQVQVDKLM